MSCDDNTGDGGTNGVYPVGNLINKHSVDGLLLQAFEVYSGRAYDNRLNQFLYASGDSAQCDNDGLTSQDASSLSFDNCEIDGGTVSGGLSQLGALALELFHPIRQPRNLIE